MIVFGEGNLQRVLDEYLTHYNSERNHKGVGNGLINARTKVGTGPIECDERLGGMLKYYRRTA